MSLDLSWDLFVIVFFGVIVCYSFIIGLNRTIKTLIGIYLAILAADGLGNIFQQYFLTSDSFLEALKLVNISNPDQTLIIAKVIIFILIIVLMTVKGGFVVHMNHSIEHGAASVTLLVIFGFLSAGLIISTLLVYISGLSFVQGTSVDSNIVDIYASSDIVRSMVDYYNFWFSMPVVALVLWSVLFGRSEE